MITTVWGTIQDGRVDLPENVKLENGRRVLVTVLSEVDEEEEERRFWLAASESSLKEIWDRPEEDVYADLLEK